jgi:hypothetical protein
MISQEWRSESPHHLTEHPIDHFIKSAEFWRGVDWEESEELSKQLLLLALEYDRYSQEYPEGSFLVLHGEQILNDSLPQDEKVFLDQQEAIRHVVKNNISPKEKPLLIHQVYKRRVPRGELIAFTQPIWYSGQSVWWSYNLPRSVLENGLTFKEE